MVFTSRSVFWMRNRAFYANHCCGTANLFQTSRAQQYLRCCSAENVQIKKISVASTFVFYRKSKIILLTISNTMGGTQNKVLTYQRSTAQPIRILYAGLCATKSYGSHVREFHVVGQLATNDQRCSDHAAFGCQMRYLSGMHGRTELVHVHIFCVGFAHCGHRENTAPEYSNGPM